MVLLLVLPFLDFQSCLLLSLLEAEFLRDIALFFCVLAKFLFIIFFKFHLCFCLDEYEDNNLTEKKRYRGTYSTSRLCVLKRMVSLLRYKSPFSTEFIFCDYVYSKIDLSLDVDDQVGMISVGTDTDYRNPDFGERPRSGRIFCHSFWIQFCYWHVQMIQSLGS